MKSLTFSCLICALNRGATKPIFCSKVAQKGKICSRLLEPQKVAPKAKSCSKVAEHNKERPSGQHGIKFMRALYKKGVS